MTNTAPPPGLTSASAPPSPAPADNFDPAFWKAVNAALDEALECDDVSRPAFVKRLHERDPQLAQEVRKLLGRAHAQTLVTDVIRHKPGGLTTQLAPVLGEAAERGFDGLLQRALRAERARVKNTRHAGERCGAWKLQEVIGTGGMGEVWLATRADGLFQAKAAVKFLLADGESARFEARFAQERALLARLNHPGIARLIDAGRLFGQPFLVLEYVEGMPLLNYVTEHAPTVEQRIALIREIGEAVSYAHSQLVVHRDLKPSNVLVTPGGHVKLLDFGVAGLLDDRDKDEATTSDATKIAGRGLTVEYAAPEQISGDVTGVGSDIYSLGSLGYHLLSGRRAHLPEKPGRAALEHAVLHLTPDRVSHAATQHGHATAKDNIPPPTDVARLHGDIDAIIARAMRIDPADRYRTMEAFVADLQRWAERRPIAARREDRSYRTRLWLRRNWLPVGLATTLFVALGTGLAISMWQYDRARAEAARANKTADYLVELLGRADPDLHGGKWPSALDLLDTAAKDSRVRFRDEPATEERLTRLFATVYRSLSRDTDALPLAKRALQLSTELHGENSLATLRARVLLAWVQYWASDNEEAYATMQPVMRLMPQWVPPTSPEWLQVQSRYANILGATYRIPESEALFRELIKSYAEFEASPSLRAWRIADAEGDLAAAYTKAGRWQEALDLLRKNASVYAAPPADDLKTALHHQGNLITVQNILGDPLGVEDQIRALILRWQKLAGTRSERIDELLSDLGLYYVNSSESDAAEDVYTQLRKRLDDRVPVEVSDRLRADLDLIEIRSRFNRLSSSKLLLELRDIVEETKRAVLPSNQRFRQILLRSALVALGLNDLALARECLVAAETKATDNSPANAARLLSVKAGMARASGHHDESLTYLRDRLKSFEAANEKVSLRRAFSQIDYAYALVLNGENHESANFVAAIKQAQSSLPVTLSSTHRAYRQIDYVRSLARHGQKTQEFERARDSLGLYFGRRGDELPQVLAGFFVQ
jgi:eukaryotic-like serine/threonine-protein kinase